MENNQPKKKKWKLFDSNRDGPGVEKGEDTTPTLAYFFKQLKRKFWKLISINLMLLLQILPLLALVWIHSLGPTTPSVPSPLYPALLGAQTAAGTSVGATLFNTVTNLQMLPSVNSPVYWIIGIVIVLYVATYGLQKVGSIYIMRNLVRGDSVFIVSDYFYAIRRDWKRGIGMGILDCTILGVLIFDFLYFYSLPVTGFTSFMYAATVAFLIIYCVMRFYMYLLLVTFDMKIFKILKHALIFTALGIKRNLMALLGIVLMAALAAALIIVGLPMKLYVFIILPFLYFLGIGCFMYTYAAYPVIKKYMIDPAPGTPSASQEDAEME